MGVSRYSKVEKLNMGHQYGTQRSMYPLYRAVLAGLVLSTEHTAKEGERLDQLAGQYYGDATYWWVIAAASGIGWGLQVPPGTLLTIPKDIGQVEALVS
jgi:nucleoid-associated protein YgaU